MAKVLLIEDNPTNLDLMVYLLQAFGHAPISCGTGEDGLAAASRDEPDLILCDLQLPGIDGYGVLRRLKSDERLRRIPVLAVTALAMVGDRERALAAGFDGYIAKPIDPDTFVQELERLLPSLKPTAKILIIEDDPPSRDFLSQLLRYRSYAVLEASDGAEGFELARREYPDLVISDIVMPTMDGFEFARQLRADADLAATPIVFYTASYHGAEAMLLAETCGVARYLVKPADPEVILEVVADVLGAKPIERPAAPPPDFDRAHVSLLTDELAERTTALEATAGRLDALLRLGTRLMSAKSATDLFETMCREGRQLIASRYALVGVLEESSEDRLRVRMASGLTPDLERHSTPSVALGGVLGRTFRELRPLRLAGRALRGEPSGLPESIAPKKSMLAAPIASPSRAYGWLCFIDRLGREAFTEGDEEVALSLGYAAGVAYENQLRFEKIEQSTARLRALHAIDHAILAAHSAEEIAAVCASRVRDTLAVERVEILQFDDDGTTARRLASVPARPRDGSENRPFAVDAIAGAEALLADLRAGAVHGRAADDGCHHWFVPLACQQKLVGSLCLAVRGPGALSDERREVAVEIAAQMAIAIDGATKQRRALEAEREYRELSDQVPVGIFRSTPDGKILRANPALVQMLGFRDEDSLRRADAGSLFVDPQQRAAMVDVLARDGVVQEFDVEYRRPDGTRLWSQNSARAVRDASGRVLHYDGVAVDVTERRLAGEAREERERLAQFAAEIGTAITTIEDPSAMLRRAAEVIVERLDAAFARVWTLDAEGKTLELQASAGCYTHIDGQHARVPVGRFKIGLIASERKPHLTNEVVGDPRIGDQQWARREGMVAFAGYPLLVEGRLLGVVAMFARRPLSHGILNALGSVSPAIALAIENRRTAAALRAALGRAEESERLKTAFLANINHEIRTPLNVIVGFIDVLRSELGEDAPAAYRPIFEAIERASTRMIRTVRSILEMARLASATVDYQPTPISLGRLVEDRIRSFEHAASTKRLALTADVRERQAAVRFDPFCLERSLDMLIDNAVKFTSNGTITVRVGRADDGELYLEVEDTGIGIDPAYLPRLFESFSQQDVSRTRQYEGLGLGLAMTKRFLALGGATIGATSERGRGSTFRIRFDRALETSRLPPVRTARPPAEKKLDRPTILVVEDDAASALLMQMLLRDYHLLVASNAVETRERLASDGADVALVLMDISLGGTEDGLALTRFIRETPALRHIRVIATTAHALPEDRERCLAAGCDAYIAKPFRREDLSELVSQMVAADGPRAPAAAGRDR